MPIFGKKEKKEQENHYGIIMTEIEQHSLNPKEKKEIEQKNKIATDEFYERYPQYLKGYAVDLKMKDINNLKRFHDKYKGYSTAIIPPQCLKVDIEKLADNFFNKHPQYKDKFEIEGIFIANEFYAKFSNLDDGKTLWKLVDMESLINEANMKDAEKKLEKEKKKEQDQVDIYGIEFDYKDGAFSREIVEKIEQKNKLVIDQFYERYPQYKEYDVKLGIRDINNLKKFHDKYKEYKDEKIPSEYLKVNIEKLVDGFFENHPQYIGEWPVMNIFIANSFFSVYPNLDNGKCFWSLEEMESFLKEEPKRQEEINEFYRKYSEYIGIKLTKEEMDRLDKFYEDFPEAKGYMWTKEAIDNFYRQDVLTKGNLNDFYNKFQEYGEAYLIQSGFLNVDDVDISILQIEDNIEICKKKIRESEIIRKIKVLQTELSGKYKNNKKSNIEKTQIALKSIKDEIKDYYLFEMGSDEDRKIINYIEKLEKNGSPEGLTKINILSNKKNYEKNFYIALLSKKYRNFKEKYGENFTKERISKRMQDDISDLEKKLHRVTELYNESELSLAIEKAEKEGEKMEVKRLKETVTPVREKKQQILGLPAAVILTSYKLSKGNNVFKSVWKSLGAVPSAFSVGAANRNLREIYSNQIIEFINKQAQIIEKEQLEASKKNNKEKKRDNEMELY